MSRGGRLRRVEPTTTSANGMWTLNEIADYISEAKWPRGPVAPTSLSASAGNAQLVLSWTAPATTHGTITNYLVEYTASGGSPQYVLTNSTSTSYTLTGLTNNTQYTVRIAAVNFTAGDYSNAVTKTPVAGVLVEYLVVAGGGGTGGADQNSGGGGAGGVLQGATLLSPGINVPVVVGAGGLRGWPQTKYDARRAPTNGGNSTFGTFVAIGGGAGGDYDPSPASKNGKNGGSGGGGVAKLQLLLAGSGGSGTPGQGFAGAAGSGVDFQAGGGGGAGGAGSSVGNGGPGITSNITGVNQTYAIGGNGGNVTNKGNAGVFGGGAHGARPVWDGGSDAVGGVVILATSVSLIVSAGLTHTVNTTARPGYYVYQFTQGTGTVTL